MSKINDLIKELCPNGVEYINIEKLFNIKNGYTPTKSNEDFWKNGDIPWFRMEDIRLNGRVLSDSIQHVTKEAIKGDLFPANSIIIATTATVGEHALITVPSIANQQLTYLYLKESYEAKINMKYIYYYCFILDEYCKKNIKTGGFPAVLMNEFRKFKFPIPPIEIQEEIVKILDKFSELEAELEAELEERKKQYEFWRGNLLNKVENIKISNVFKRVKGTTITAGKMKEIEDDNGNVRIFAGGQTAVNASVENIPNANIIDYPCVIVQSRGLIDFIYYDKPFTFKSEMWAYTCENQITVKYLYYYLKNKVNYFRMIGSQMGSMPQISLPITENFEMFLPPLEEQEKIVNILDRFDGLINDIKEGIPAEIELRRRQYEYYRNKLLNFEMVKKQ